MIPELFLQAPPVEIRLLLNHIYEYKKGVRRMVLYTLSKTYESFAIRRLKGQGIAYYIQEVSPTKINLFFGHARCIEVVEKMVLVPLNELTTEQDFILGTLLGYDVCQQCERYCLRKGEEEMRLVVS